MFVLGAANLPLTGEYEGANILDIAPTLMDLAGYSIPESMQGKSLVAGMEKRDTKSGGEGGADGEDLIFERLSGLGYI
jgi:arylsulfatase A-like enzyme